jgi:hypothetical protein
MGIKDLLIVLLIVGMSFFQCSCIQPENIQSFKYKTNLSKDGAIYIVPAISNVKILPSSSISDYLNSDTISISASPGEFESASFVIHPHHDINSLLAEATDLIGENDSIPAINIDISVVKVWYQAGEGVGDKSQKLLTPELLLKDDDLIQIIDNNNYIKLDGKTKRISDPTGIRGISQEPSADSFPIKDSNNLLPVYIKNDSNKQFWIKIKTPADARPGLYKGKILLNTSLKENLGEIKLLVRVLPITLLKPYLKYSIYYTGIPTNATKLSWKEKSENQFKMEMKDILDHGITNPAIFRQDNGLGRILQIRNEVGIDNQTLYYTGLQIDRCEIKENITALKMDVTDLKEYVLNYGVKQVYIYAPDESSLDNYDNRNQIRAVHEAGGKVFDSQNKINANKVADILDLAVVSGDPDRQLANKYHNYGNEIFSYGNPQVGVEQPETYRRNYGLLLWQRDYDGAMNFAYQYGAGNIWNDFDSDASTPYRDHVFAYPTINGVIDTLQWEGWREGVDDVRYLTTLLEAIRKAKLEGKDTAEVENWVANLKNSDLSKQNLDYIRATMIDYILNLGTIS